ncbi:MULTISPECIES: NifU family protein [Commensalibacter]|uniref:4Fe-4S-binding domain (NifU) (PDB:2Z51) n=2 Tax=Commensalibacter TaxID=1079922 RepID=A0ABM9HL22_9PROT|nr:MULTISPECIES: NifU family protein [Commensalibacter]EUK19210.1 putative iron-sulfur cluster scaffold, NifU-like protein [Commensalibacter papalotli (ex Servin-Garciduenas et al. 2014)]CAI3931337.1 4Fe-4S-binding domain (NifU) (PDB:2Z51) [Commensalibacter papalotli (ex Botero et al. 2024)]CAI3947360.1 4Fe-4S-binding domain (NifU) (PDB:2Z51) [Commensalibacter papalotli (ex Botero et al. 2024)]
MMIHTEETPNVNALKFILGRTILQDHQAIEFSNREDAACSPLAQALFDIEGIQRIYFGTDFIVVTKDISEDWKSLKGVVISIMMEFLLTRKTMIKMDIGASDMNAMEISAEDQEIVDKIKDILDDEIRPAVARDGGDIIFHGYKEGCVYLKMQGACQGCPSSSLTLKHGVETILRRHLPDLVSVEKVDF